MCARSHPRERPGRNPLVPRTHRTASTYIPPRPHTPKRRDAARTAQHPQTARRTESGVAPLDGETRRERHSTPNGETQEGPRSAHEGRGAARTAPHPRMARRRTARRPRTARRTESGAAPPPRTGRGAERTVPYSGTARRTENGAAPPTHTARRGTHGAAPGNGETPHGRGREARRTTAGRGTGARQPSSTRARQAAGVPQASRSGRALRSHSDRSSSCVYPIAPWS